MKPIEIHTDGSYSIAKGRGGWAAIIYGLTSPVSITTLASGAEESTSNRMEMQAVITALEMVGPFAAGRAVVVHSDSQLVVKTMTEGWRRRANKDLWTLMDKAREGLSVRFLWHERNSTPELKECDRLAKAKTDDVPLNMDVEPGALT